jgi:hypothetical protein
VATTVEAAINGEIILGEDRDMVMPGAAQHCRDDKCIVELAERCGDDVCVARVAEHCKDDKCILEVTGDEYGFVTGNDGLDCDDTDCERRPAASKKGYDAYQAQSDMKAGFDPRSLNETTIEYLRNKSELRGVDFGLAVAYAASGNEQVRNVRYNNETDEVEIEHVEQVRLFGFIPMRANAKSSIRADGEVRTQLPWWSFVATKSSNSTAWMNPKQISTDALKKGDRMSTETSSQPSGEEVDILGMGEDDSQAGTQTQEANDKNTSFKAGAEISKSVN